MERPDVEPRPETPSVQTDREFAIGSVAIGMPAVQAALSGYSDLPMRRVARAHGAPYCINEVVLDANVVKKGKLQRLVLDVPEDDHPVGGQLMGADPATFGQAAKLMAEAGYDVVDINFGCPVPRVLGRCRGGFLLGEPETALAIVGEVLDACADRVPVTVKMRRGLDDSADAERAFWTILDGAFDRGIRAVTVHGRSVEQRYEGPSSWPFLARVKRHLGDRTVLGSGDLFGPYDVLSMLDETGVDGVTVARGCIGNPWIFTQVRDLLAGRAPRVPTVGEQRAAIELHWRHAREVYDAKLAVRRSRTHAIKYAAVHPDRIAVRDAFAACRNADDLASALATWYPESRADEASRDLVAARLDAQTIDSCAVGGGKAPAVTESRTE